MDYKKKMDNLMKDTVFQELGILKKIDQIIATVPSEDGLGEYVSKSLSNGNEELNKFLLPLVLMRMEFFKELKIKEAFVVEEGCEVDPSMELNLKPEDFPKKEIDTEFLEFLGVEEDPECRKE